MGNEASTVVGNIQDNLGQKFERLSSVTQSNSHSNGTQNGNCTGNGSVEKGAEQKSENEYKINTDAKILGTSEGGENFYDAITAAPETTTLTEEQKAGYT